MLATALKFLTATIPVELLITGVGCTIAVALLLALRPRRIRPARTYGHVARIVPLVQPPAPSPTDAADVWLRLPAMLRQADARAAQARACQDKALQQVDAAEYTLGTLLAELAPLMPDAVARVRPAPAVARLDLPAAPPASLAA